MAKGQDSEDIEITASRSGSSRRRRIVRLLRAAAIEPAATRRRAPGRAFVRLTNVERGGDPNSEMAAPSAAPPPPRRA